MTSSDWRYAPRDALEAVISAWLATDPTPFERAEVHGCLMDVVRSPMVRGTPDPDHPGIWEARVQDTNMVFTYIPHAETLEIFPVDLSAARF